MRSLILALGIAFAIPAAADPISECIAENVSVEAKMPVRSEYGIKFDLVVKNGLNIPVGGFVIYYELWADGRPMALSRDHFRKVKVLDGAVLSGETITVSETIYLRGRQEELFDEAPDYRIDLFVENAADIQLRPLGPHHIPFVDWDEGSRSDQLCAARSD